MAEERGKGKSANPEAEIAKYEAALLKDPKSRVFAPLAESYRKAGFLDDAVRVCREGLTHNPGYISGRVALARALSGKGEYVEARESITKVVQAAPDNLMAQKLLGQIELSLGHSIEAQSAFQMVLMIDPRDEEAQRFIDEMKNPPPPPPPPPAAEAVPAEVSSEDGIKVADEVVDEVAQGEPESVAGEPMPLEEEEGPPAVPSEGDEPAVSETPPEPAPVEEYIEHSTEPFFDLDDMAARAAEEEASASEPPSQAQDESPFEVFTKEPRVDLSSAPTAGEGGAVSYADIDLADGAEIDLDSVEDMTDEMPVFDNDEDMGVEATIPAPSPEPAYAEPVTELIEEDPFPPSSAEGVVEDSPPVVAPVEELADEIPVFDLTEEEMPPPVAEPAAPAETVTELTETETKLVEEEPSLAAAVWAEEIVEDPLPAVDSVEEVADTMSAFDLDEDIAGEAHSAIDPEMNWKEQLTDTDSPHEEAEGAGEHRGMEEVFNTETLAGLYISQGFYGKAADVYRRLLYDRPDDAGLQEKLRDVLHREKMEAESLAVTEHVFPLPVSVGAGKGAAATDETGEDRRIVELRALLKKFKGLRKKIP